MNKRVPRPKLKVSIALLLAIWCFSFVAFAQDQTPEEKEKSTTLHYMGVELGMFFTFSGADLTDDFNLEEIIQSGTGIDASGMLEEVGFNAELTDRIDLFKKNTFVNLYTVPLVEKEGDIFDRLNYLANGYHDPRNAPFINVFIWAVPEGESQFKVKVDLDSQLPIEDDLKAAESTINAKLTKTYDKVRDAKQDVNEALLAGIDQLEVGLGGTYYPPYMIGYDGTNYAPGNEVEMWSSPEAVELYAAKHEGEGRINTILANWKVAGTPQPPPSKILNFNATTPGTYKVEATIDANIVNITVRVKEGNGIPSVRNILKAIVREVFDEKHKGMTDQLASLREDSTDLANSPYFANNESIDPTAQSTAESENEIIGEEVIDWYVLPEARQSYDTDRLVKERKNKLSLLVALHVEQFLNAMIDDPAKFDDFIDDLMVNSGRLLARFTLNALKDNERQEVKVIVTNYVNERIDVVAYESL